MFKNIIRDAINIEKPSSDCRISRSEKCSDWLTRLDIMIHDEFMINDDSLQIYISFIMH